MRASHAETVSIGVIGAGFAKAVHVPAFRADPRCVIAAIAASTSERARRAASEMGIEQSTGDWRDIVDDADITAVAVVVPPTEQAAIALRAIGNGKHVFLEKPVAVTVSDVVELCAAASAAHVVHAVDFGFPELEAWKRARQLLPSIGPVRHAMVRWHFETYAHRMQLDSWKLEPGRGGGTVYQFFSHALYNIEWLLGPIARLVAHTVDSRGVQDVLTDCWIELASGASVSVSVAASAVGGSGHTVEVYGESGSLLLHNPGPNHFDGFQLRVARRAQASGDVTRDVLQIPPLLNDRIEIVGALAGRFIDAIVGGGTVEPNLTHGLRVQRLLEAVRRSHEEGRWLAA